MLLLEAVVDILLETSLERMCQQLSHAVKDLCWILGCLQDVGCTSFVQIAKNVKDFLQGQQMFVITHSGLKNNILRAVIGSCVTWDSQCDKYNEPTTSQWFPVLNLLFVIKNIIVAFDVCVTRW